MPTDNPCLACGACCAYFRVSFYWQEPVPEAFKDKELISPHRQCMKGTNDPVKPRCEALKGEIGKNVHCSIYENRPSPCRAFSAYTPECNKARSAHNLKPIQKINQLSFKINILELPVHLKADGYFKKIEIKAFRENIHVATTLILENINFLWSDMVFVEKDYRRQGIATRLYVYIESKLGKKITKPTEHSDDAQNLWNQPNRPFGQAF